MIKIKQAVVVEGKYDKITLGNILDTLILTTDGFGIFKDEEKLELLRCLAKARGVVVLTDSDSAGFLIRNRLNQALLGLDFVNVYVPEIEGRERRKRQPSSDGLLGVEGMSEAVIFQALEKAGVICGIAEQKGKPVTKLDMYEDGLFGADNSKQLRVMLCKELGIPTRVSSNMLPELLTDLVGYDDYKQALERVKKAQISAK